MTVGLALAAAVTGGAALPAPSARAAEDVLPPLPAPNESMEARQAKRSGYEPQGAHIGGILLHADASVERRARLESFDAAPHLDAEHWQTAGRADLSAAAGTQRWVAEASAGVEAVQGSGSSADDTLGGHVGLSLKMPLGPVGVVKADAGWRQDHEPRTTPLADGYAGAPTRVRATTAGAEVLWRPGRLALDLRTEAARLDYGDVPRLGFEDDPEFGTLNNDDRDRDRLAVAGRAAWRFGPLSSVYLRGTASTVDYHAGRDDFGVDRDHRSTGVYAGLTLGRSRLWRAFLEVGRMRRAHDSQALPAVDVTAVNGGLTWATTPLMTNQLRIYTSLAETTEPFVPAVVVRGVELETEHELLRSLVLTSTLGVAKHDYRGPVSRTDVSTLSETGARWRLGRMLRLEVAFSRERLESPWLENGYTVHEALLRVGARF